jgi:hypothetical protein
MITPKDFRLTNQLLSRLIHDPETPDAMRQAAKNARKALFRYRGGAPAPIQRQRINVQEISSAHSANPTDCTARSDGGSDGD